MSEESAAAEHGNHCSSQLEVCRTACFLRYFKIVVIQNQTVDRHTTVIAERVHKSGNRCRFASILSQVETRKCQFTFLLEDICKFFDMLVSQLVFG